MRNDGSAIMTRTTTGMTVHNTSTNVLCVVRDGVGWALALNFTITITSIARTNAVTPVTIHNTKVWSQITSSITGLPDSCKPICQGVGCPKPANAAPSGIRRAAARAAIAMVRKKTGMVVSTPRVAPACGHLHHELRIPHKVRICFGCVGGRSGRAPARTLSQPARPGPINHNSTALAMWNHNSTALARCNHDRTALAMWLMGRCCDRLRRRRVLDKTNHPARDKADETAAAIQPNRRSPEIGEWHHDGSAPNRCSFARI